MILHCAVYFFIAHIDSSLSKAGLKIYRDIGGEKGLRTVFAIKFYNFLGEFALCYIFVVLQFLI